MTFEWKFSDTLGLQDQVLTIEVVFGRIHLIFENLLRQNSMDVMTLQHVATLVRYSISLTCFKQPPQGTSCPGPSLHGHNALRQAHQGSRRHITQTKSPWPHHHSSIPSIRRINELERISMLPCSSYGRKIKTIVTRCHEKQFLPSHPNGLMVTPWFVSLLCWIIISWKTRHVMLFPDIWPSGLCQFETINWKQKLLFGI